MKRAFLSLYAFIVMSVVLIGWGLDKFWENVAPPAELAADTRDLIAVLTAQFLARDPQKQDVWLQQINDDLTHQVQIISLNDLAGGRLREKILAGEIISVSTEKHTGHYQRLGESQQVLVLQTHTRTARYSPLYSALLVTFYLAIAVVIFIWVWPVSRDLNRLENQTRLLGRDGVVEPLAISNRSRVYPLAAAFNNMARRIRELISSHKEMTYAVSHELRTPLARMKFALAMAETATADQANINLENIRQDIAEMENLINSLLLYAGFEQSSGQLDRRDGHMKAMLDNILQRIYREHHPGITIEVIDHTPAGIFNCEWQLIETVMQNLLQNALRFARHQIRMELMASAVEFYVSIEDDGPGIPDADKERVFASFVRLYNEDVKQAGGFGLGLAIARRIIQWHGGTVAFTDSSLGGAKAELRWPRLDVPDGKASLG